MRLLLLSTFALAACSPGRSTASGSPTSSRWDEQAPDAAIVDVEESDLGSAMATADVDGDGVDDLVVAAPYAHLGGGRAGAVLVFSGVPAGTVDRRAASHLIVGPLTDEGYGRSFAVVDADHDGWADLLAVASHGGLYGVHGPLAPVADATASWLRDPGPGAVAAVGDVDGDGFVDWSLSWDDGGRVFTEAQRGPGLTGGLPFAGSVTGAGDVDGDGLDDVLVTTRDDMTIERADGAAIAWNPERGSLLPVGDVDGDGAVDALVGARSGTDLRLVRGPLVGDLSQAAGRGMLDDSSGEWALAAATIGDTDGDGQIETVVVADADHDGPVYRLIWLDGPDVAGVSRPRVPSEPAIAAGDLDGDGTVELAIARVLGETGPDPEYVSIVRP